MTQPSEGGVIYPIENLKTMCDLAHSHGLLVHMDGACFPAAVVQLGVSPAAASCDLGVDVVTFGGTKSGGFAAEAIVYFDTHLASRARLLQKRCGQALSKMRFLASQWSALLSDGAIYSAARHAINCADTLAMRLAAHPCVTIVAPHSVNILIVKMPSALVADLKDTGAKFITIEDNHTNAIILLVTSFETTDDHILELDNLIRKLSGARSDDETIKQIDEL